VDLIPDRRGAARGFDGGDNAGAAEGNVRATSANPSLAPAATALHWLERRSTTLGRAPTSVIAYEIARAD
jgi:hypothetical protein